MKNANKIRQLLESILEIPWQPTPKRTNRGYIIEIDADDKDLIIRHIQEAIALLPCDTCGGTKQIKKVLGNLNGCVLRDYVGPEIPCPDCQISK